MSSNIFENKINDERINSLKIPLIKIQTNQFNIIDAIYQLGLSNSKGDAKRIIKSGGVIINNTKVVDHRHSLTEYINNKKEIKIVVGKKKFGLLKLTKNYTKD